MADWQCLRCGCDTEIDPDYMMGDYCDRWTSVAYQCTNEKCRHVRMIARHTETIPADPEGRI